MYNKEGVHLRGRLLCSVDLPNLFGVDEGFDVDIVMGALEEDFALEVDHLALLGGAHGADEGLEVVGAFLVVEQHTEFHPTHQ